MKISNKQFYNEKCNDILPIRSKIYCKRAEIYCGIISFVKTGFKRNIETILLYSVEHDLSSVKTMILSRETYLYYTYVSMQNQTYELYYSKLLNSVGMPNSTFFLRIFI